MKFIFFIILLLLSYLYGFYTGSLDGQMCVYDQVFEQEQSLKSAGYDNYLRQKGINPNL